MKRKNLLFALLLAIGLPWVANAQTVTVCDGTDNSEYVPFEGYNADAAQHNQMIFPATDLSAMNGKEITQMVFYIDQSASNGSNTAASRLGTWTVSLGETTATTLSGLDNTTTLTQVYQGYFDCSTGTLTLAFSSNYLYHGGNLLVDLNHAASSWNRWYFLGVNQTENTAITRGSLYKFLPKTTFSYQTPPTCPTPGLADAQNITDSQASFSWTENGSATNWVLQYSTSEEFTNATSVNVQDTPAKAINDFQPLTTYYVRVKADCGEGDQSQWSNVISFSTTAVAQNVGDAWSDDFEGTTCGWELINGDITNAWAWGTATNNGGTHALYVSNDGGTTNAYTNTNAAMVYATKLLTFADGKYEFSYDWNGNGESTWDYVRVALVPASVTLTAGTSTPSVPSGSFYNNLPTGWIAVDGGSKLNLATAWQSMSATANVTAGNYYMVLAWRNDGSGGTNPPAAVDNVSITKVACDQDVTNLAVSEITTSSATLSWDGGEATQWQVAYSTASNFEGATEEIVSNASYDMSGLQSSSTYFVKVRAYCGGEDFGTWCQAISFATACDAVTTFPWSEDFENYNSGDFNAPCWVNEHISGNGTQIFKVYTYTNGNNSTHQLQLPDMSSGTMTKLMLPVMTLPSNDYLFSIDVYRVSSTANYGEGIRVFVSTDGEIEGATELAFISRSYATSDGNLIPAESASGWYTYELPIGISGTCYIILRGESLYGSSTYMDNFAVKQMPSCLKPTALECTATTTTSATFSWTNGAADQTAWQICLNGDETNLIDANSNPFTVEGITASTSYTAKVRAYCGADDQSDWSNEVSFATECEAITVLPWNENFDAYTGSTSTTVPTGYPNDELPICWQFLNRSDNSSTYPLVFISSNSGYPVSGNCLFFKSSSTTPLYAVLPAFEEEIAALQLTFTYRNEGTSDYNGTLIVGYMTNPADATTFTTVLTCERTTTLTEKEAQFTNAPAGSYIAFMYQNGSSQNYYLSIDNVKVEVIPTCTKPTDLEFVSSTTTTATLSWTAGANETAWQICLNGDETNLIEANSNPFTVENLTTATAYTAKVRAYCGEEDQSDWSNEISFATECDVIVVDATHPLFENFDGITSGIPVCWDNSEGTSEESYKWNYYATGYKDHCVRFDSFSNSEDNTNFLKTPVMVLPSEGDNLQLSFWYKNPTGGDFSVFISTDGGDTYTTALASDLTDQSDWTNEVISLSEYAGNENVVVVFAGTSNWGYGDAYIYLDEVFVGMPFTKHIIGYASEEAGSNGDYYYLIASPLAAEVAPTTVDGMITDEYGTDVTPETSTYDLYSFDEAEDLEWQNYRAASNFNLVNGQGYLYASKNGTDLTFIGAPYSGTTKEVTLQMTENENADFQGWNLVGNPFTDLAYIDRPFYRMDATGTRVLAEEQTGAIQVMEGVFVIATVDEEHMTFNTVAPNNDNKGLVLNLSQGRGNTIDRAIVGIGQGHTLPKFMFNPNDTKLYIPQNGKDYAVVRSRVSDEVPVNFLPTEDGYYNISVDVRNMNLRSLVLKDKVRNVSIDLLRTPNYMFKASAYDRADRFVLSFKNGNGIYKEKLVKGANPEDFSFYSNGVFVIDNEGEANLQVIDLNGRVLSSENIYGSTSIQVDAAPGIYLLRLTNGDNVKVQKVVVE